jgi:transcriptional regulator with XRE-family HTH domain
MGARPCLQVKMDGQEFKQIRQKLGLSAAALGRALGYQGSDANVARTIYRLESGRQIPCPVKQLLLMFDAFGVPRAWVGKTARHQHNVGPKWCDHASFREAELQVDLFALAMERIVARQANRRSRDSHGASLIEEPS